MLYNTQINADVFSDTQLTLLRIVISWQLISNSSIGRQKVIVQEHEWIPKLVAFMF
jgi:hypothetical protein